MAAWSQETNALTYMIRPAMKLTLPQYFGRLRRSIVGPRSHVSVSSSTSTRIFSWTEMVTTLFAMSSAMRAPIQTISGPAAALTMPGGIP